MRKLTLIVTIAFAVVVGLTVATIALAQEERTDSEHLAKFAALMQYVRSEPTPADVKAETVPTLAYLDTVLSGTYITGFITPYTGETEDQVKARLESLAVEDRFTAIMVESYRVSSDPTLLDIVHQLLPLYYVQFFTTSDGLDASREFLTGANIQTMADAFDPSDYAIPTPSGVVMPTPTPTPQPNLALVFDPDGPDRDCSDFANWQDAQAFYWATENDSHDLDPDGDGVACETLPSAPQSEVQIQEVEVVVTATPTPTATPVPTGQGLSRAYPWPMGDTCFGYLDDFCVGVNSVDWDAWPEIQDENQFNTAPLEGHTFVMVEIWLLNHSDSELWSGGVRLDLSVVGQGTNVAIQTFDNGGCGSTPDALPSQDVFQDGEVQGHLCFVVPDSDLDTLVMRYEYSYNSAEDLWYSLR